MTDFTTQQIIRKDGRNCFCESLCDSFAIGKAHFRFVNYDTSAEKGSRQTARIDVYLDANEMLGWANDIALHIVEKALTKAKEAGKYEAVLQTMGGVPAETLKKRGQERPDGKSLSRVLTISYGQKQPVALSAKQGPGDQDEKGLIVPKFGKNPEQAVFIALPYKDFMELFVATAEHYKAYLVYHYAHDKPFQRPDDKSKPQQTRY